MGSLCRPPPPQVPALELTPLLTADALPPTLAHGTRRRCWDSIRRGGLAPMGRTHIHLAGGLPGDPGVRSGKRGAEGFPPPTLETPPQIVLPHPSITPGTALHKATEVSPAPPILPQGSPHKE